MTAVTSSGFRLNWLLLIMLLIMIIDEQIAPIRQKLSLIIRFDKKQNINDINRKLPLNKDIFICC